MYDGQRIVEGNDEAGGGTAAAEELSGLEILLLETAVEFNVSA